ncbi:MAG: glutathione S-transferase [Halomonas sp.]|nr:glutathione S-transferase [Halomonas sp.]
MIQVHHLEKSRSHRIFWLLETLALDYEIITYPRDDKTELAPESLKRVHPLGKSPIITDGDITVAESGAIIDYLLSRYGEGRCQPDADDTAEWANYRYWMHYAEGSLMPLLTMRLVFSQLPKHSPWLIKPISKGISDAVSKRLIGPQLRDHLAMIESHLRSRQQFSTAWPSGADVQMSFPLKALSITKSLKHYPATEAFVARIEADLAWQRVVERVGPLTLPG